MGTPVPPEHNLGRTSYMLFRAAEKYHIRTITMVLSRTISKLGTCVSFSANRQDVRVCILVKGLTSDVWTKHFKIDLTLLLFSTAVKKILDEEIYSAQLAFQVTLRTLRTLRHHRKSGIS